MRHVLLASIALSLGLLANNAPAALIIDVGDHELAPNQTGQAIDLFVVSTDPENDPSNVAGINLNAFLGDGSGSNPEPIFGGGPTTNVEDGGVVLTDGSGGRSYIWDVAGGNIQDADTGGNEQFQITSFTFGTENFGIQPDGLLGTLYVDTTGFTSGTYDLILTGGGGVGLNSTEFIESGGATFEPTIINGSITITSTAVPEPGTMVGLFALAGGFGLRRYRARKRSCLGSASVT